jgi:peptidoglycan hydrolase-like protein with peptidoglycan-binding domain
MVDRTMHRRSFLALTAGLLLAPLAGRADDLVARIQQALNRLGYDAGSADGVAGSRTERAIKAFQADFGHAKTGKETQGLLDQLDDAIAAGAASPERLLRRAGLLRSYTRAVQEALAAQGYDPGPVDGAIGPQTRTAIRDYQARNGLPADGEVSRALLASLLGLG